MMGYDTANVNHSQTECRIPAESRERMKAEIKGNELIITIEMQSPTPSASGKTLVVASSHGNQATTAMVDGKPIIVGFNAYIKK